MNEAIKGMPPLDFKAPPNTKFAQVGPNKEAFRPGTEPSAVAAAQAALNAGMPRSPAYNVIPMSPGRSPVGPTPAATPPAANRPPKPPDELNGLY